MIWQGTVQQTHSCVPDALQQPSQCLQRASKSKPPLWYKWWSCLYKMLKPTWPSLHKNRPARKGKLNSPPLHMLGGSGASHQALTQPLIQPSVSSWPASSSPPSTAGHSITVYVTVSHRVCPIPTAWSLAARALGLPAMLFLWHWVICSDTSPAC